MRQLASPPRAFTKALSSSASRCLVFIPTTAAPFTTLGCRLVCTPAAYCHSSSRYSFLASTYHHRHRRIPLHQPISYSSLSTRRFLHHITTTKMSTPSATPSASASASASACPESLFTQATLLLTNDDGIRSPTLLALAQALMRRGAQVVVVAPEMDQSACGQKLTLEKKLQLKRYTERAWSEMVGMKEQRQEQEQEQEQEEEEEQQQQQQQQQGGGGEGGAPGESGDDDDDDGGGGRRRRQSRRQSRQSRQSRVGESHQVKTTWLSTWKETDVDTSSARMAGEAQILKADSAPDNQAVRGSGAFYSLCGTPTDCIIAALEQKTGILEKLDKRATMVISGINIGPNLGSDIIYSGTFAAAKQAGVLGVPSLATSIASYQKPYTPQQIQGAVDCVIQLVTKLLQVLNLQRDQQQQQQQHGALLGQVQDIKSSSSHHSVSISASDPDESAVIQSSSHAYNVGRPFVKPRAHNWHQELYEQLQYEPPLKQTSTTNINTTGLGLVPPSQSGESHIHELKEMHQQHHRLLKQAYAHGDLVINLNIPLDWYRNQQREQRSDVATTSPVEPAFRTTRLGALFYRECVTIGDLDSTTNVHSKDPTTEHDHVTHTYHSTAHVVIGTARIDKLFHDRCDVSAIDENVASVTTLNVWPETHPLQVDPRIMLSALHQSKSGLPKWIV